MLPIKIENVVYPLEFFLCKSCGFWDKHKEVSITELLMLHLLFVTVHLAVKKRSSNMQRYPKSHVIHTTSTNFSFPAFVDLQVYKKFYLIKIEST